MRKVRKLWFLIIFDTCNLSSSFFRSETELCDVSWAQSKDQSAGICGDNLECVYNQVSLNVKESKQNSPSCSLHWNQVDRKGSKLFMDGRQITIQNYCKNKQASNLPSLPWRECISLKINCILWISLLMFSSSHLILTWPQVNHCLLLRKLVVEKLSAT